MKKSLPICLVFVLTFLFVSAQSNTTKRIKLAKYSVVYFAPGESVFHLYACEKLGRARTGITVRDALSRGFTPCPDCIPFITPGFREIAKWEGSTNKATGTFTINSKEWKISWDTKPSKLGEFNFQIYLYKENGELKTIVANVIGKNSDSSIIRGAGNYYIEINTSQPYKVIVEEKTDK